MRSLLLICALPVTLGISPAAPHPWQDQGPPSPCGRYEAGLSSWYGARFHDRVQANGHRFDQWAPTAAHRKLPLGTRVIVTRGARRVEVTITDRGPQDPGRVLDLSRGAAHRLRMLTPGVAEVTVDTCGD